MDSFSSSLSLLFTSMQRKRRAASVLQSRTYTEFASSVFSHPMTTGRICSICVLTFFSGQFKFVSLKYPVSMAVHNGRYYGCVQAIFFPFQLQSYGAS